MDLTTMNLAALSSLNEAESGLTEKSTNIGVDNRSKRVKYCSELKASQKLSKNKKNEVIKNGVIKKRDEPRSSQLVNSRKSENRPIQVQEKYKVSENAGKSYSAFTNVCFRVVFSDSRVFLLILERFLVILE